MRIFHSLWAYLVIGANLGVGGWGIFSVRRNLPAPPTFFQGVLVAHVLLTIQVLAGVALLGGVAEKPNKHMFYGFVVLIAAVLTWAFRGESPKRAVTVLSAGCLFIGAVAVRGITVVGS